MTLFSRRRRSVVALTLHQLTYERRTYWRNPVSAFFTFAFPIVFLVLFASLNLDSHLDLLNGIPYNQYYVPSIAAFGIISACYSNLGVQISFRRDGGIFKRLRGTPLPAVSLIGAMIGNALMVAALLFAITMTVGTLFYGLEWHGHLLALACAVLLGAACFCSLGVAISTFTPNGDAAPAVVNFALFPLTFVSGTFFPVDPSSFFAHLAGVFPIQPFTQAVFAPFDPQTTGLGFSGHDFLVMGIWTLAGTIRSVRAFRWEPRREPTGRVRLRRILSRG
jgi:ABC-2 type transport system permease protein